MLHCGLECWQIDFVERAIRKIDVGCVAVGFVIIECVVLDAGRNTSRLQSLNIGGNHDRCEIRILAHILEVAAIEGRAIDVDARTQDHVLATVAGLLAQGTAIAVRELWVPGGSQASERRKSHAGVVGLPSLFPLVPQHIGAHAMRSVIGPEVGQAKPLDARRRELALRMDDGNLVVERKPRHEVVDARFYGLGVVEIDGLLRHDAETHKCLKNEKGENLFHNH